MRIFKKDFETRCFFYEENIDETLCFSLLTGALDCRHYYKGCEKYPSLEGYEESECNTFYMLNPSMVIRNITFEDGVLMAKSLEKNLVIKDIDSCNEYILLGTWESGEGVYALDIRNGKCIDLYRSEYPVYSDSIITVLGLLDESRWL